MHEADRIKRLPRYLFTIMDELKAKAVAQGQEVIDLGMGNPDLPSPAHAVEELCRQAAKVENQRYSRPNGDVEQAFKRAVAAWYRGRFGVTLDPLTQVLPLIGSKEGIAHLALAFMNPDDIAIVPSPAYPPHGDSVIMAGGTVHTVPLAPEAGYVLDLAAIPESALSRAKILFVSYPHNPTSACVDLAFYERLVAWARGRSLIVCSDLAYSDIVFDGYTAPSLMQAPGVRDIYGIEFHTVSKSYNMAGWRVGFAVGHPDVLRSLEKTKSYIDFGNFRAVQLGAIQALTGPQDCVRETVDIYRQRRDVFVDAMRAAGWPVPSPRGTFYLWAKIPPAFGAMPALDFASRLVEQAGVVVAPGAGFGALGEGYVRFSLVQPEERLRRAADRIGKVLAGA
ncbi:MAG: aminotransferase class I/II-fold pyridoxal phosphate-dependent enzyme [Candidatus Omnitrophica bacterium]|nr:aminotransferase class I/II-fold pyridoxal phosphate-dependent enzyme [Candidatus Omnitrophota bacterium]